MSWHVPSATRMTLILFWLMNLALAAAINTAALQAVHALGRCAWTSLYHTLTYGHDACNFRDSKALMLIALSIDDPSESAASELECGSEVQKLCEGLKCPWLIIRVGQGLQKSGGCPLSGP